MEQLHVTLAGAVSFRRGNRVVVDRAFRGRQVRLVTAVVVLERPGPISVDVLADALWQTGVPDNWRVGVRGLVGRVRRHLVEVGLDGSVIRGEAGRYHVELPDVVVDLEQAETRLAAARERTAVGDHEQARMLAGRARAVLSRPVMAGIDSSWLDVVRRRVTQQHHASLVLLGTSRGRVGQHAEARAVLEEALSLDPVREDAWRALMRVEANAGNAPSALRVYERCRRLLVNELGVDPSAKTQQLHATILRAIPTPDEVPAAAGWPRRRPVPGPTGGPRALRRAVGLHDVRSQPLLRQDTEIQHVME